MAAAAVAAGGTAPVHGLSLVVGDPAAVATAAREAAWRDAWPGPSSTPAAGLDSARSWRSGRRPAAPDARPMRLLAAPAAPAVEPGESDVWAAVTVTWALRPG